MKIIGSAPQVKLTVGDRVYNHGDVMNPSHFGTITAMKGDNVEFTPDMGSGPVRPYWVYAIAFDPEFKGHSGTRLVTEAAYNTWRETQIKAYKNP